MRISNKFITSIALCGASLVGIAGGDEITLTGGQARLSGNVRTLNPNGSIELKSDLTNGPIFLKGDYVQKIDLSSSPRESGLTTAMVYLVNGDRLPAVIDSLDERTLSVVSPDMGHMEIPRDIIQSLQPGIRSRKVIYQGPLGLEEWTSRDGGMANWTFKNNALISSSQSTAEMKLGLPANFVMKFTLVWQDDMVPNFQIFFADPHAAKGTSSNRYYMQFGGAGIEIKREAATGKRYHTLATINQSHEQFPKRRMDVRIEVNRDTARIRLILNGELADELADPIAPLPDGGGITLVCNTANGGEQQIRDIEILEHDETTIRHRSEDRGDPTQDSLITREDERWTGQLLGIRHDEKGNYFRFKTSHRNEPFEIPENQVSMIFIASGKTGNPTGNQEPPFRLRLHDNGTLGVNSCGFEDDSAIADHSLLGRLNLKRSGILAIEKVSQNQAADSEE